MVFQDPFSSLNPARKIGWILEEPLRLRGITDRDKRRQMVADMLVDVGLDPSFVDRRPRELSGGQRQRISIGTALLMDSRLIIADEPVSALDVTVQSQILRLILRLHDEKKMTILFITHDLNIVRRICRRVVLLYRGEIVESGLAEEIYRAPAHPYTELLLNSARTEIRLRRRRRWQISAKAFRPVSGDVSSTRDVRNAAALPRGEAGGYDGCCRPYGQVFPADVNFVKTFSCNLSLFLV